MNLYERVAREGLTAAQRDAVFRSEMRDYRNGLDQIAADWKFGAVTSRLMNVDRDMMVYESIWSAFAQTGVIDGAPDAAYAEKHFGLMAPEMREAVCALLGGLDVRASMLVETTARLRSLGIEPNSANMAVATALVLQARAEAAKGLRLGIPAPDDVRPTEPETPEILPTVLPPHHIPEKWRLLTPVEAAELMIASNPSMFEHRKDGKRAESLVGEQTFRQIRWAAALLQKSMNPEGPSKGIRPLWTVTTADIVLLDKWFDRLPATCGKSPWDREPETTLEAICNRALERIDAGELCADSMGLGPVTSNKHFRKIKQIYEFVQESIVSLPDIKFSRFILPDLKDARSGRDAYSVEQGEEIFRLPPWTGCASVRDRFSPGSLVVHDSLFFVLLLVWYTGMRREEVCKLLISDVMCEGGIWHLSIRNTSAGRVKNHSSVRLIAICDELLRLGFAQYFEAIREAGHDALFPELVAERQGTKKGDVFYRIWWIHIAPLLIGLARGQALHAARHSFDTELKELEVFPEHRNDAMGHAGKHGEERRYSKAVRLRKLKGLVDKVPIVTRHLPDFTVVSLLPAEMRVPRPARQVIQR